MAQSTHNNKLTFDSSKVLGPLGTHIECMDSTARRHSAELFALKQQLENQAALMFALEAKVTDLTKHLIGLRTDVDARVAANKPAPEQAELGVEPSAPLNPLADPERPGLNCYGTLDFHSEIVQRGLLQGRQYATLCRIIVKWYRCRGSLDHSEVGIRSAEAVRRLAPFASSIGEQPVQMLRNFRELGLLLRTTPSHAARCIVAPEHRMK